MSADRRAGEAGAALPIVMLAVLVLTGITVVLAGTVIQELRSTAVQRDFEGAVHAAEAGGDLVVGRLNDDSDYTTGHVFDPTVPERDWARAQFDAARTAVTPPASLITTPGGQSLGIRPEYPAGTPLPVIYGVGEVAGTQGPELRIVKMAFDEGFYTPALAFLTGCGNPSRATDISGNATVTGSVHSNCTVTVTGNVAVTGPISSAAPPPLPAPVIHAPAQALPTISARALYDGQRITNPPAEWYDLCPDRTVRAQAVAGGAPCSGSVLGAAGAEYRGWRFQANEWRRTGPVLPGVYYAYRTSVRMEGNGSPGPVATTVIVDGGDTSPPSNGTTGNIDFSGNGRVTPYWQDLLFIADKDIEISGNTAAGGIALGGFVGAHEQIDLSGNAALVGAVVAEDAPHTAGSPVGANGLTGNVSITFDGTLQTPLSRTIRLTAWNEL